MNYTINEILQEILKYNKSTYTHMNEVCFLCNKFGSFLKLSEEETESLSISSLLHDVGKLYVPNSILDKKGALTTIEFEVVKKHPEMGLKIIKKMSLDKYEKYRGVIKNVVLTHHIGGRTTYPITNQSKSWQSEIVTIVDIYEALTGFRYYKKSHEPKEALVILNDMPGLNKEYLTKFSNMIKLREKSL